MDSWERSLVNLRTIQEGRVSQGFVFEDSLKELPSRQPSSYILSLEINMEVPGNPHHGSSASQSLEALSAEFSSKIALPYLNAPTLSMTARMQAKLINHNNLSLLTLFNADATAMETFNRVIEGETPSLFQSAAVNSNPQRSRGLIGQLPAMEGFQDLVPVPATEAQLPGLPLATCPSGPQAFLPLEQFLLCHPRAGIVPGRDIATAIAPRLDHLVGDQTRDIGLSFLLDFDGTSTDSGARPAGQRSFNSDIEVPISEKYENILVSPRQRETGVLISDANSSQDESPCFHTQHGSSSRLGAGLGVRRPRFKHLRGVPATGLQPSPRAP